MRRRSRTRRVLKWVGMAISATITFAFIESTWRFYQWGSSTGLVHVEVAQGCFMFNVLPKSTTRANRPAPGFLSGENFGPMIWWPQSLIALRRFNLLIPLWMPLLLVGSVTAWLWRLDRPPPLPEGWPRGAGVRRRWWQMVVLWVGCTLCVLIAAMFVMAVYVRLQMRAQYAASNLGLMAIVEETLALIYAFAAVAIPTLLVWRLAPPWPPPGHCPCGYDLTGNVSGTCPECGVEVPA